ANVPTIAFPAIGRWQHTQGLFGSIPSGNPFLIPDSLIHNDTAHISLFLFSPINGNTTGLDTTVHNGATDVYVYPALPPTCTACTGFTAGYTYNYNGPVFQNQYYIAPRDVTPAPNPDHFKVRVLNLGATGTNANLTGNGAITLTYADGTPVSIGTSN